jgi:hypothetical protein
MRSRLPSANHTNYTDRGGEEAKRSAGVLLSGSSRIGLIIFWIVVSIFASACVPNANGEDGLKALFGFLLLVILAVIIVTLGVVLAFRSAWIAGCYVGLFLAFVIVTTLSTNVQFVLIGGMLGVSLDKVTSKTAADLPVTLVDRLALLVSRLADTVRDASSDAVGAVRIRSVRRGVWAAVLTILTALLLGKVADNLGITGTAILQAL